MTNEIKAAQLQANNNIQGKIFTSEVTVDNMIARITAAGDGKLAAIETTGNAQQQAVEAIGDVKVAEMNAVIGQAADSAALAESYAKGGTNTRTGEDTDNSLYYKTLAAESASTALGAKDDVDLLAEQASGSAQAAATSATLSESYAVGGTGTRAGENSDNAEYYATHAASAKTSAEAAQTAAETAQGKAEDAQTAAETAQTAAETAQSKAEDAQEAAEAAQTAAETAQGKAEEAASFFPTGGTTGQVLKKKSGTDYDTEWADESGGGGGGTTDYTDLSNKPQINSVTLSGNKSLSDLGIAAATDIPDVTSKADKVSSATNGNFAALDSNGNLTDSGHKHSDYLTSHQDITGKANKVSNATNGNFAGLDSNGDLTDSGKKASDFATTSDVNAKYAKPSGGIPSSDMTSAVQTSLGKADTAYQKPSSGIPATDIADGVIPDDLSDVIADEYSTSSTYAVGDYCIHSGSLYRCTTAISTAESWTSGHWTEVTVGEEVTDLKGALSELPTEATAQLLLSEEDAQAGYLQSALDTIGYIFDHLPQDNVGQEIATEVQSTALLLEQLYSEIVAQETV